MMNNPIELLNKRIDGDLVQFSSEGDTYMYNILKILKKLVRTDHIPDYLIPDINAMIGMYLDECQDMTERYNEVFETMKVYVDRYQDFCYRNDLSATGDNFKKLKEYKSNDAIYG